MITRTSLSIFLLIFSLNSFTQDEWGTWEKNYQERNYTKLFNFEKKYADSIEANQNIPQYYARIDKYKIKAKYLGESRSIDKDVLQSMKNVFKLFIGDPNQLNEKVKQEFLFDLDGKEVWMPIQTQLEKPFKEEVEEGNEVILYCLFVNEHRQNGKLFNTFFISEFRTP